MWDGVQDGPYWLAHSFVAIPVVFSGSALKSLIQVKDGTLW